MTRVYEIKENNTSHYIDLSKINRILFEDVSGGPISLRIIFNEDELLFSSYNGYIGGLPKDSEKGEVVRIWICKTAEDLVAAWKTYTPHVEYVNEGPVRYGAGGGGSPGSSSFKS